MKKVFTLLTLVFCTVSVWAQSPQKMSYQAVIRNSSGQLVTSLAVGMKISILKGSVTGSPVYIETQTPTSNANGLVSIEIGGGTLVSGNFAGIDWANGPYFLKTETDPSGGKSYSITGTSQLLSVPYALHAKIAESALNSKWITSGNNMYYNTGNIGIGTSFPTAKLQITGSTPGDAVLFISPNKWIGVGDYGDIKFGDANHYIRGENTKGMTFHDVDRFYFEGGNVGIGKSTPTSKLDVIGEINVNSNKIINVATPVNNNDAANKAYVDSKTGIHYVGESYGGGIVFYVYDNGQHGLIAATADQSTGMQWYNGTFRFTGAAGDGLYAGEMNTAMIVATQMADNQTGNFAAKVCADYSVTVGGVTYGDWYLPSKYELNLLYAQKAVVGGIAYAAYWSSTEYSSSGAFNLSFGDGRAYTPNKMTTYPVRAVRAF